MTKTEKKQIIGSIKDLTLTSMAAYHKSQNWADLWEDWHLSLNENGQPKYRTINRFAHAIAKNDKQKRFLQYYLGPELKPDEAAPQGFDFVKPQDWQKKRDTGGWKTDENVVALHRTITTRMQGLDAMRAVGNTVTLHGVTRAEQLAKVIDTEFNYGQFPEQLDYPNRVARLRNYIELQLKVAELQEKTVLLYAKCHGINFDDMNSLAVLLQTTAIGEGAKSASRVEQALNSLTKMTLIKSEKFKTPVPADAVKIIDGLAEEIPDQQTKIQ